MLRGNQLPLGLTDCPCRETSLPSHQQGLTFSSLNLIKSLLLYRNYLFPPKYNIILTLERTRNRVHRSALSAGKRGVLCKQLRATNCGSRTEPREPSRRGSQDTHQPPLLQAEGGRR